MKKTFKRVLSTVLALCVLLASATCLMGMSVSADETPANTTVFVWENAPLDQYLRFGGCGYTDLLKGIADVLWGQDEGEEVKISFDYYNPDGGS
ncbi:MAG: hypothetical protein IKL94_00160, partial [Clostridia bacterium]|nr:hypothetical protein [Clostridia bacterium]